MSASDSQILDQTEPMRGVKHVKPPIKPPVKPKPLVPPRPKEITGYSTENKSPLLSPTCGPCSPTLDIPSALKISQLTGPQPYGTRRTSLKRWSSSVGEDANLENNVLSPVENKSIELPAKIIAQPLSAALKPLQTGPAWKGKSPFMLTTRGWGEQRMNQSKDSEAVSLKSSSSVLSKDTDAQKKETTALKEDSNSYSRNTVEEKVVAHVQDSITRSEKTPTAVSEDVTMGSSGLGSSNRPAQVKKIKREFPSPLQSDLHIESNKQTSQYDHQKDIIMPIEQPKIEEKASSSTMESLQVQKTQIDDDNEKMAIVDDGQILDVKSRLGHVLVNNGNINVNQGQSEKREENHQPEAHVDPCDPQQIRDDITEYAESTNTAYEERSHHEKQEPKDLSVTSILSPPKPKERKKPSVQFIVPKPDDPTEGQTSLDYTVSGLERQEPKEYKHKEEGNADMRIWHGEDNINQIPVPYGLKNTDEEETQEKSAEIDEPSGYVRTQMPNYKVTIEDIVSKDPTDYTSHMSDRHEISQENIDVCQPDIYGSSFHHKEPKIADEEVESSISYTTKLNENEKYGNQDIDRNQPDDVVEDYRSFPKRQEEHPAVKNVDYMPHLAHTPPNSSPRSEHENYEHSSHDSGTIYIHNYKSTMDRPECHDIKEPSHMSIESQSEDKLPSQEINTHSMEFHPPALTRSQEELTQIKNYESNHSKPKLGYLEDLESSKSEEVQFSNFEDPTYKVIQSMEISNTSDHKDGLQYYNIYSQNLQDRGQIKQRIDESEDHDYSHSHIEEPLHEHAQSEEPVRTYEPSEGLVSTVTPPKEMVHTYSPFEEQVDICIASVEPVHTYAQSEERDHTYGTSEEPVHKYAQFQKPMQDYSQLEEESNMYAVIKKPKYEYDQSENLEQMYEQPEKQVSHNVESEELTHSYEPSMTQTLAYEQHMKPIYTYDEIKESYPQDSQTRETEKAYEQVYEHTNETFEKYVQPEDLPKNIIPNVQTELHYRQTQAEEPVSKSVLSEKIISSEMPLELPNYQQAQSEVPDYRRTQTEDLDYPQAQSVEWNYEQNQPEQPNYQKKQTEELKYQQLHSEEPNYQYKHSDESYYQEKHSQETSYQYKHSEQSYYQQEYSNEPNQDKHSDKQNYHQKDSDEPNHQQEHSDELIYQETQSDELNFRYAEQEKLQYKGSEDSHVIRYYSEQSEEKDDQIQEGKTKMFGENYNRLPNSTVEEYMNLHAVEKDGGHVTSAEQDKPKSTLEKFLEQQDSVIASEKYHHEDDSTTETYDKKLPSKEQKLEYTQNEEPKTLDTHTIESELRDVASEQQDLTDSKETDKHSQLLESHTEETQDTCAKDNLGKHTLNERNINGHSELEESEHIEEESGGLKLPDETHNESPVDTASDTEETPKENFDFLEGTNVLDTSLMRGRASLGKKRCHRTPAAGNCAAQEESDPEYWMFRDSTEPTCSPGKDSDEEEKEETSTDCTPENSPTSVKSPTKKGGIFSGIISPSILKGRLKSRNKAPEGESSKSQSKESQEPTSPGKDKSESSSHSLSWLQALKKKKKKNPK